mgnify:CR=1 FL=1
MRLIKGISSTASKAPSSLSKLDESVTYGLYSAQERGVLFIGPGEKVYSGMVIGENAKTDDIEVNVCKTKHLTNTRSSSADEALRLTTPKVLSLEEALDFIDTDELLEVTPENLRIRKKILDPKMRKRGNNNDIFMAVRRNPDSLLRPTDAIHHIFWPGNHHHSGYLCTVLVRG